MPARHHVIAAALLATLPLVACASGVLDETAGSEADITAEGGDAAPTEGRLLDSDDDTESTPDPSSDASSTTDASPDASSVPDASSTPDASTGTAAFGTTCASPTIYTDPFTTNPLGTRWQAIVGNVTHSPGFVSLGAGAPNTQAWIGLRQSWDSYSISVPVRIDSSGDSGNGGITFRMMSVGTANDSGQMYYAGLTPTGVVLGAANGSWTHYTNAAGTFDTGVFYTLKVTANGNALSVSASGGGGAQVTATYPNATAFATGSFGFRTFNMAMTYGPVTVTCN